ncbi:uncharacterized protein [Macrobrachium rosenbergii]|uniref:uncharacterized protein n=1 Tax=Macrobrachium rosenbergii TaxID=79674 RepID=UPI0034D584A5
MEEADVKQLISLIESAQLQYEVDESGTVSIVCDPVQLVESASIDSTQSSLINEGSLLTHQNGAPVPTDQAIKTDESEVRTFDQGGGKHEKVLQEQKIKVEQEEEVSKQSNETNLIQQTPETTSPIHYFLQTTNGEIIQVLETLDDVNEESTEGVAQSLEGISSGENFNGNLGTTANEDMQIFVVGDCSGGDMFLINTPERHLTQETGESLGAPQTVYKGSGTISSISDHMNKEPEEGAPLPDDKDPNIFLNVAIIEDDAPASKPPDVSSKMNRPIVRTNLHRKPSLPSAGGKQYVKLISQTKPRLPLRDSSTLDGLPTTLAEGSVIQTNKGEMMAYSLSSVTKDESPGKKSVLHNIASSFGSWLKVLRPVDQEKEVNPTSVKKRFTLYSCEDCGTVLHSERSLKIHRRRFHEEWDDECFICGEKFLNQHYVRNHVREVHSEESSFECRYCSFRCSLLKEFFKHCRVHKKSQICGSCGKKYASPKLFQDHVTNCTSKPDAKFDYMDDVDCDYPVKIPKGLDKKDNCISYQTPVDITASKKKLGKNDSNKKRDLEYKVESKHYSQQIKKMALEQSTRSRSQGRYRTHRCYLCFKLFSNSADLDAHKEVYHQVKSSQPVRVKTDDSLGREEEDTLEVLQTKELQSCDDGMDEGVQIKSEPPDITESIENVTIVLDEYMNLSQVIKPLCIACKAYTKTDFRESCKLFQNISKFDQSEALKKFEKFFPCALNHESLVGPWVLCKKCSVLIDKITDMEEKLLSMKSDLMSRLQGNADGPPACAENKSVGDDDDDDKKGEQLLCKLRKDCASSDPSLNILSDAFDTEKYVRESFEIMEIIQPAKRKRKHKMEGEKLAPVLLSDDDNDGFSAGNETEYVSNTENSEVNEDKGPEESAMKIPINLSSVKKEIAEDGVERSHDIKGANIKSEPLHRELESVVPESGNPNWTEDEGNPLNAEERLNDDFLLPIAKPKKDSHLDPELFHHQLLTEEGETSQKESCKGNSAEGPEGEDASDEVCQEKVLPDLHSDSLPSNSSKIVNKTEVKPDEGDCMAPLGHIQEVLKDLDAKKEDLSLKDIGNKMDSNSGFETFGEDVEAKEEENSKVVSHEPLQKPVVGKKRARIREERNMMSYRLEGNVAKPWVCSSCHKGFSTQRGACDHYAASHGGQSYSCEHCSASYVRKRDLIGHYNRVHLKAKPYKCKKCSESFSMHSQLYRHMHVAHMEEKKEPTQYTCHLCDASFSQKRYRDAHLEACETKASDVTPYTCLLCDKSFKLEKYLGLHMRNCHSVKSDAFFCEICNKVLNDKRNLILHMKSHSGETKTSCTICHKQFSRKAYLWTHMRVHTNERPYGCNYCPKWFKQYSTWKNHERTHTGEKPYKCTVCNSCFATSSSVSKHLQYAHYNIRDFGCTVCKKYFISKAKLEEHMKTHTGEKPFKCPVCGRAFNKKTNLRTHMYIHSTNKRFKCEICGEGFMRRTAIENHILERHRDLELLLASDMSDASKGKANGVTAATSPFISVIGAEDVNSEDTYIVVYADEDKDPKSSKDMQVTVLVDDVQYSQVRSASKKLKLSLGSNQIDRPLSRGDNSEVTVKEEASTGVSGTLPGLITAEDETDSSIQAHDTSQAEYL